MGETGQDEKRLYLGRCWIFVLFWYYSIVFLAGLALAILAIEPVSWFAGLDIIGRALVGAA